MILQNNLGGFAYLYLLSFNKLQNASNNLNIDTDYTNDKEPSISSIKYASSVL